MCCFFMYKTIIGLAEQNKIVSGRLFILKNEAGWNSSARLIRIKHKTTIYTIILIRLRWRLTAHLKDSYCSLVCFVDVLYSRVAQFVSPPISTFFPSHTIFHWVQLKFIRYGTTFTNISSFGFHTNTCLSSVLTALYINWVCLNTGDKDLFFLNYHCLLKTYRNIYNRDRIVNSKWKNTK